VHTVAELALAGNRDERQDAGNLQGTSRKGACKGFPDMEVRNAEGMAPKEALMIREVAAGMTGVGSQGI
jgi:hypothetical protein